MKVSLDQACIADDINRVSDHLQHVSALAGQHILITGCTGFFGKWLLATLAAINLKGAGITVTVISRSPESFLAGYAEYKTYPWLFWLKSDVRSLRSLPMERPVNLIIHAATDTSAVAHSDALGMFDTIVEGARQILDLAIRTGASRILFTGSGAQYGAIDAGQPVSEDARHACESNVVTSVYAEAKRVQETLAAIYAARHGVEVVFTRCFAFAGPGIALDGHFAIGNFVRDALWRDELVLQSNGQAVRSYLHGADLATWLLTLLVKGRNAEAYNVGSDQALSIVELARRVVACIAPGKLVRVLGHESPGQPRSYYVPDIGKARALGLDIWTSLDDSITSMARWANASS